jgi:hypothetical protein
MRLKNGGEGDRHRRQKREKRTMRTKKATKKEIATYAVMPGIFKPVPVCCYESESMFGVVPADAAAFNAIKEREATEARRGAHVVISVRAASGEIMQLEMPQKKHDDVWIWTTHRISSMGEMLSGLKRRHHEVVEIAW